MMSSSIKWKAPFHILQIIRPNILVIAKFVAAHEATLQLSKFSVVIMFYVYVAV